MYNGLVCARKIYNFLFFCLQTIRSTILYSTQHESEVDKTTTNKSDFSILHLTDNSNDLQFICDLLTDSSNVSALHLKPLSNDEYRQFYDEMRVALLFDVGDELNYIIRKETIPVAWLKINGLKIQKAGHGQLRDEFCE